MHACYVAKSHAPLYRGMFIAGYFHFFLHGQMEAAGCSDWRSACHELFMDTIELQLLSANYKNGTIIYFLKEIYN